MGSCATHVPPSVSAPHPGSGHCCSIFDTPTHELLLEAPYAPIAPPLCRRGRSSWSRARRGYPNGRSSGAPAQQLERVNLRLVGRGRRSRRAAEPARRGNAKSEGAPEPELAGRLVGGEDVPVQACVPSGSTPARRAGNRFRAALSPPRAGTDYSSVSGGSAADTSASSGELLSCTGALVSCRRAARSATRSPDETPWPLPSSDASAPVSSNRTRSRS